MVVEETVFQPFWKAYMETRTSQAKGSSTPTAARSSERDIILREEEGGRSARVIRARMGGKDALPPKVSFSSPDDTRIHRLEVTGRVRREIAHLDTANVEGAGGRMARRVIEEEENASGRVVSATPSSEPV